VISSRLMADDKIQLALEEEGRKRLRALSPYAIHSLEKLITTPSPKDHARGLSMVLDRAYPVDTTHHVKVEHETTVVVTEKVLERIRELSRAVGMDPSAMKPMIDVEYTVVEGAGEQ
jgi:hypothetical protein